LQLFLVFFLPLLNTLHFFDFFDFLALFADFGFLRQYPLRVLDPFTHEHVGPLHDFFFFGFPLESTLQCFFIELVFLFFFFVPGFFAHDAFLKTFLILPFFDPVEYFVYEPFRHTQVFKLFLQVFFFFEAHFAPLYETSSYHENSGSAFDVRSEYPDDI
jgi:hypothetical protein